MRAYLRIAPLAALVLIGGCAYIGQAAFEDKKNSLDQDKDGSPLGGQNRDCDDSNANKTPGADEIPYDGWDNDCEGGDVIDLDGDGFAGISKEEYLALTDEAEWPTDVDPDLIDCRDDPDVHADAAQIFPTNPNDIPYDGIDSDCRGDNDFDVDLDGFLPDTYDLDSEQGLDTKTAYDTFVIEWEMDLPTPIYGDCDDFAEDVNPGVSEGDDVWYDGIDQNCDGNNDFDQDGDGYMPDKDGYETDFDDFIDKFHGGESPFEVLWDDCLDDGNPLLPFATPKDVYPGNVAGEIAYDGIDSDCSCVGSDDCRVPEDNDFDQDGDGVMPDHANDEDAVENFNNATFDGYIEAWGYDLGDPGYGDCDDFNSNVFPGALELLGDNNDQDCSLEAQDAEDITPFGFDGLTWDNPRPPRVDATDSHYILATSADEIDLGGSQPALVGAALAFEKTAGYKEPIFNVPALWQGATNPQPLGASVDLVTVGDVFWASTSYTHSQTNWTYVVARKVEYEPAQYAYIMRTLEYAGTNIDYGSLDVDLVLDTAGEPWASSCGLDTLHALKGIGVIPAPFDALGPGPVLPQGVPGGICFWESAPDPLLLDVGTVVLCDPGVDCVSYDFDPVGESLTVSADQSNWTGSQFVYADHRDGWIHTINNGNGATLIGPSDIYPVLMSDTVLSIDADWRDTDGDLIDDTLYVAAVVDRGGAEVVLLHGDPDVSLTEISMPFEDLDRPGLVPEAAAIYTDEDRLFMAVTAANPSVPTEDAVGWIFLGWP